MKLKPTPRWEYAELECGWSAEVPNPLGGSPMFPETEFHLLRTPQGIVRGKVDGGDRADVIRDFGLPEDGSSTTRLLILNTLGKQGWELVAMTVLRVDSGQDIREYLFRRRTS